MKPFQKFVLWLAAASFFGGAVLLVINFGARLSAQPRHMISAVLLAVLVVGAVRLAAKAMAAGNSDVIEHAPEMSSLAFPRSSSYRK
jgi:hypothetical protein